METFNNSWTDDIENIIFTRIKKYGKDKLSNIYPDILFTTTNKNSGTPTFPTVYVHAIGGSERGADLEGKTINAILYSVQIDVYHDKRQDDVKKIMSVMKDIMKGMSFNVISLPENTFESSSVYRSTARFRRTIGSGDKL